ncbi:uncharacterized protein LOC106167597 [Lingula anatina]|uniref:Uncharacterized protein LOC106167597 n=1 Tax=Lingula anatina TaxID=7574 RepID=A0A1S3IWC7_LINAN|nr:uncharacterized protein LOC106167597 [Lingula anatina]|eukprot:XP_013401854.1 uncharacterized protein LOC106167597 [Lingula anatina]
METVARFIDYLDNRPTSKNLCCASEGILSFIQDEQDIRDNFEYGCIMDLCDCNGDSVPDLNTVLNCDESLSQSDLELGLIYCSEDPLDAANFTTEYGENSIVYTDYNVSEFIKEKSVSVPQTDGSISDISHVHNIENTSTSTSVGSDQCGLDEPPDDINSIGENLSRVSMDSDEENYEEDTDEVDFGFFNSDDVEIEEFMEESFFHEIPSASTPVTFDHQLPELPVPDIDNESEDLSSNNSFSESVDFERSLDSCNRDHLVPDVFFEE